MDVPRPAGSQPGKPPSARERPAERRLAQRFPARNIGFYSNQIQAHLVDLSRSGLAIESLEHPPIGSALVFSLEQGPTRVNVDGVIRWCNLKRTYRTAAGDVVPVYRAGIRLGQRRPAVLASIVRAARQDWVAGRA